jgi:hypothetical protein
LITFSKNPVSSEKFMIRTAFILIRAAICGCLSVPYHTLFRNASGAKLDCSGNKEACGSYASGLKRFKSGTISGRIGFSGTPGAETVSSLPLKCQKELHKSDKYLI